MSRRLQATLAIILTCSVVVIAGAALLAASEARQQTTEVKIQTCFLHALAQDNFQIAAYGSLVQRSKDVNAMTDATKKAKNRARLKHDYRLMLASLNRC